MKLQSSSPSAFSYGAEIYNWERFSVPLSKYQQHCHSFNFGLIFRFHIMVYSHWLGPELELGQGPGPVLCRTFHIAQGPGRIGCMVLIRTFHIAPEQAQGRTLVFITGHIFRTWKMGTRPILQVLKIFHVFFPVPVQVQCERFLLKLYNPFFQVPVPVPVPVPDQASVNTPWVSWHLKNCNVLDLHWAW